MRENLKMRNHRYLYSTLWIRIQNSFSRNQMPFSWFQIKFSQTYSDDAIFGVLANLGWNIKNKNMASSSTHPSEYLENLSKPWELVFINHLITVSSDSFSNISLIIGTKGAIPVP